MNSKNDYLLIGNTRLHWAKKIGNIYKFSHSILHKPFPKKISIKNLLWASVGKYETNIFRKENEIKTTDINLRNFPKHFGVDRALGSFAALTNTYNPFKKDIVIADFGTILSITKINYEGYLIGGQLIPGFITQLSSMEIATKNLKMPDELTIPKDNFLVNTEDAMLKGVENSLIGAINLAFNPNKDLLIICGGDSAMIRSNFLRGSKEILIKPNLVMEGMIMFCQKNKF